MNISELRSGLNTQHYGKVVAARAEHDLPIGGINPFHNFIQTPDFIINADPGDEQPELEEQPTDSIHF